MDLRAEVERLSRTKKKEAPLTKRQVPDALVLCIQTSVCAKCGSEHQHPNPYLLFRTGKNYHRIDTWADAFNTLPRETRRVRETITCCDECFEVVCFSPTELVTKEKP